MSLQIIEPDPLPPPEKDYVVHLSEKQAHAFRAMLGSLAGSHMVDFKLQNLLDELNGSLNKRSRYTTASVISLNRW